MTNKNKPLIVANWKLNHTKTSTKAFLESFLHGFVKSNLVDVAIAPVATLLDRANEILHDSPVLLAAQNVFFEPKGAFTGEYSVDHIKEMGASFCIVGHSERRNIFHETDKNVNKKVLACLKGNVTPIVCIGETSEQRSQNITKKVLKDQCEKALFGVDVTFAQKLVFAYEPIWAIGSSTPASLEQILEAHDFIRATLGNMFSVEIAKKTRILYGGSVNNSNVAEIISLDEVDGVLVGGASLQVESFLTMVDKAS